VEFCFHEFSQSLVSKHALQMPAVSDTLSYMGHLHINIRALYDLIITPDNSILFSDTV
jgi:hypothetical protein